MSHLIGSHIWCQCLLSVYSAPAWEISHQATTWTQAWWVDSIVTEPGPHLRLICLAVENNDDVIGNLVPCVKYGKGIWLSSLNSIPKPFSPQISDSVCTKFPEIPSWDYWNTVTILLQQEFQPCVSFSCSKHTAVFLNACCSKMTNNWCEVTNGCHALWRPVKITSNAEW